MGGPEITTETEKPEVKAKKFTIREVQNYLHKKGYYTTFTDQDVEEANAPIPVDDESIHGIDVVESN